MSRPSSLAQIETKGFNPSNPATPIARWMRKLEAVGDAINDSVDLMGPVLDTLKERGEANVELDAWWRSADRVVQLQHEAEEARDAAKGCTLSQPRPDPAPRCGVPVNVISSALGHRSIATTATYLAHIQPQEVINALKTREWKLEGVRP